MQTVTTVLFIFSQINPLDNVALNAISKVEKVGEKLHFHTLVDGEDRVIAKSATPFIMNQIEGFNLPLYEC